MNWIRRIAISTALLVPLMGIAQQPQEETQKPEPPKKPIKLNYELPALPASDTVVATVNDEPIRASELLQVTYDWFAATAIEDLIIARLVEQEARKHGITVSHEEVEARVLQQVQNAEAQMPPGMSLEDFLKRNQFPPSRLYMRVRIQMLAEKLVEREVDLNGFVEYSQIVIRIQGTNPEEQEKNAGQAEEKARKAYEALKNGLDFAEAVKEYSEDPFSKDRGGKMPWQNKQFLVPDIRSQLEKLQPGQYSEPFRTMAGYMIVKLERTGAQASPEEQAELRQQGVRMGLSDYIRRLQSQAKITNAIVQPYNPESAPPAPGGVRPGPTPRPTPR
ncbi:MAG: hypothetical protein C4336_03375 [Armatimonadota bacterium]